MSAIKGGWLAKAISPAKCISYVISDVVGDDLSTIASGPLHLDGSTIEDAKSILKKYTIHDDIEFIETPKEVPEVETHVLANHETAANAAKAYLDSINVPNQIITTGLEGDCDEMAKKFASLDFDGVSILAGETTVNVTGDGLGGRNQQFVLSSIAASKNLVLSIGTDGVDGICVEKVAGSIAKGKVDDTGEYLENNDSNGYFKKNGGLIITGPTGTNLGDLILIAPAT